MIIINREKKTLFLSDAFMGFSLEPFADGRYMLCGLLDGDPAFHLGIFYDTAWAESVYASFISALKNNDNWYELPPSKAPAAFNRRNKNDD